MGWTSQFVSFDSKDSEEIKKFFVNQWNVENFRCLDYSKKGNIIYMAVENIKNNKIFAVVTRISFYNRELYWKEMRESCGPVYVECPQRILKKLSPTDNEYAKNWREKCWEFHKKKAKKYMHGDIIKFPNKIEFTNGFSGDTFILVKEGRRFSFAPYRGEKNLNGVYGMYKITSWRKRNPEVIRNIA